MEEQSVVLVVDDVKTNVLIMRQCLKEMFQVWTADSGEECLRVAKQKPDIILLDVLMPGMDGYQVCRQLKADPETAEIPIIFVTAKDSDEDEQKGLEIGAVDYITKPIRPAIVRARVSTHIQLKQHSDKLKFMALHDQLTGLYNRHFLAERAAQSLSAMVRHQQELSIVMLDLDHFKKINDFNGHHIGDLVLQAVAKLLQDCFRKEDVVARMGGEEFVILMECGLDIAREKTEDVRQQLARLNPMGLEVTGSFGVVTANPQNAELSHLLVLADEAVYKAKADGRNCVVCYQDGAYLTVEHD
ncbi:diguanylate cyclase [Shewanella rhizosphaerae]|uniref:diguanylate cyclase n=1 Tax=Shewanella TaxID=22 RepID=UPI001C655031|nr:MULTISPECIES: diguanylate cyclase [Shewanella]QYJ82412.1 diguanylate cyclase [Shewanella aegiceratis]QYK12898.1 diguanylate cyclase [Shewanella rhizosphaerae]